MQPVSSPLTKTITMFPPGIPVHSPKEAKPFRFNGFEFLQALSKNCLTPTAIQVYQNLDTRLVHHLQKLRDRAVTPPSSKSLAKVVVRVDYGEARLEDRGLLDPEL